MNRFRISTPEGTRDLLFSSCRALRQTENAVRDALEERGYSEIITPAVEYFDVFAQANPELDQDQMLKIIDKSGRICVARPDNTTPIARIAATRLDDAALAAFLGADALDARVVALDAFGDLERTGKAGIVQQDAVVKLRLCGEKLALLRGIMIQQVNGMRQR